jgi:hypothetical protein
MILPLHNEKRNSFPPVNRWDGSPPPLSVPPSVLSLKGKEAKPPEEAPCLVTIGEFMAGSWFDT